MFLRRVRDDRVAELLRARTSNYVATSCSLSEDDFAAASNPVQRVQDDPFENVRPVDSADAARVRSDPHRDRAPASRHAGRNGEAGSRKVARPRPSVAHQSSVPKEVPLCAKTRRNVAVLKRMIQAPSTPTSASSELLMPDPDPMTPAPTVRSAAPVTPGPTSIPAKPSSNHAKASTPVRPSDQRHLEVRSRQVPSPAVASANSEANSADESAGPARAAQTERPKFVVEMERRAEERNRVREERRERQRQREEERAAAEQEAEEARRCAEEQEKRKRLRERYEKERAIQLQNEQRQAELAHWRDRARQARSFWEFHRLVDVWCALRHAALETAERSLDAWRLHRMALASKIFAAWWRRSLWATVSWRACHCARVRQAQWQGRRHAFRALTHLLALWVQHRKAEAMTAREALLRGLLRRCTLTWKSCAVRSRVEKEEIASCHSEACLGRRALTWWRDSLQQIRLEAEMEAHRQMLQEKVSGWLQELDAQSN